MMLGDFGNGETAYDSLFKTASAAPIHLSIGLPAAQIACMAQGKTYNAATGQCVLPVLTRVVIPVNSSSSMPGGALSPSSMPVSSCGQGGSCAGIKLNLGAITAPKQSVLFPFVTAAAQTPALAHAIMGIVQTVGGGTPAGLAQAMPQIGFEQHAGLWTVADATQPVLQAVLSTMTFQSLLPNNGAPNTPVQGASLPGLTPSLVSTGTASFVIGQTVGNALSVIQQAIASGQAALLDKNSVASGILNISFTADPATIATMAGPLGNFALLSDTSPAPVLAAAAAALNGGQVPPAVVPAAAGSSKALTYGLVAGGVVIVGIVAYMAMQQSHAHAKANRRRRRRYAA